MEPKIPVDELTVGEDPYWEVTAYEDVTTVEGEDDGGEVEDVGVAPNEDVPYIESACSEALFDTKLAR